MPMSLIYLRGLGVENAGGGWSWVRGVVRESDGGGLSRGHSEDDVRGTPVFHMSKSFRDDLKGCKGDWKFSHPA